MSKQLFLISRPQPPNKPLIVGVGSVSEDSGVEQRIFSQQERELVYWGLVRIYEYNLSVDERNKRIYALLLGFLEHDN